MAEFVTMPLLMAGSGVGTVSAKLCGKDGNGYYGPFGERIEHGCHWNVFMSLCFVLSFLSVASIVAAFVDRSMAKKYAGAWCLAITIFALIGSRPLS